MVEMNEIKENETNETVCKDFCGACPSHPGTDEWLFCAKGRSSRIIERSSCLCSACQVYLDNDLKGDYFCVEGTPK